MGSLSFPLSATDLTAAEGGRKPADKLGQCAATAFAIDALLNESLRPPARRRFNAATASASRRLSTARADQPAERNVQAANDGSYALLDDYSAQSDAADLAQWSDLAAYDQRVPLERPIAAMQILAGEPSTSGQRPTAGQISAALNFVHDNPSLRTALQNKHALRPDGGIDRGRLGDFLKDVRTNLALADKNLKEYQAKHPDAPRDALNIARAAALLQAYLPIAGESAGHRSNGKDNNYAGGKNGGGLTSRQQIDALQDNEGFSASLKAAAKAWSSKGAFDAIDRSGDDKATKPRSDDLTANNVSNFVLKDAPSDEAAEQDFLWRASVRNITADTDIQSLGEDVLARPQNYAARQKAAVMIKLMETLVDVVAGGADGLRDVRITVAELQRAIAALANDPATAAYLRQTAPPEMQSLGAMFEQAGGSAGERGLGRGGGRRVGGVAAGLAAGAAGRTSLRDAAGAVKNVTDKVKDARNAVQEAKTAVEQLYKLTGAAGKEIAERAASRVLGLTMRAGVRGAMGALTATMGALAGAGPAGWVLDAVLVIPDIVLGVLWIVELIRKHQRQAAFADNVNPTLRQFGMTLPS
ncbi:type III effector HrpK domain-containing protein [Burkholderia sp. TSV86]|uniref:type III effector HrpK domain-containing protein n=1 Tax=Burkholderia sp. TSV86 TaxID=1385594 RepID=UPI0007584F02|nr:type III effector HrpK domain-containing protein [Burkholderia sp. TSV86]KVE33309.1 hypothetical protein WS68_12960 [Burkholderia sp. TSV86]